jgi:UPF0716 family protein affecting phage T7 exclusion
MLFSEIDIDWTSLLDVIYISAIAGILIATVLGAGIVAQLRAQDSEGNAIGFHAVTVISVLFVAAAVVVGIGFIVNK